MRMLVSDMAGRANIQIKGEELGFDLSDRELAARITDRVKDAEAAGYTYEAADASFELLLRRELGQLPEYFTVHSWRVFTQSTHGQRDRHRVHRTADRARARASVSWARATARSTPSTTRSATRSCRPTRWSTKFELIDYRVRILDQGHGTDATVRVLIQTTDGLRAWTTVGVGQNIVEASWEALCDAYLYGLIHA